VPCFFLGVLFIAEFKIGISGIRLIIVLYA
jgi:hypothetical protein